MNHEFCAFTLMLQAKSHRDAAEACDAKWVATGDGAALDACQEAGAAATALERMALRQRPDTIRDVQAIALAAFMALDASGAHDDVRRAMARMALVQGSLTLIAGPSIMACLQQAATSAPSPYPAKTYGGPHG